MSFDHVVHIMSFPSCLSIMHVHLDRLRYYGDEIIVVAFAELLLQLVLLLLKQQLLLQQQQYELQQQLRKRNNNYFISVIPQPVKMNMHDGQT